MLGQGGKWEVVKTVNTAPNCSECGMAAVDGKLYLTGNDGSEPTSVESFDPTTLKWTKLCQNTDCNASFPGGCV